MPYVPPSSVVAGTTGLSSWGNAVKAGLDYQANGPSCRVYNSATQSIANTTTVALTFNSERWDPTGMHSTVTLTNRITFLDAGVYALAACVSFQGNATGRRNVAIRIDGATTIVAQNLQAVSVAGVETTIAVSTLWKVAANAYAEVVVFQDSGIALNSLVGAGVHPEFSAQWVSLG